MRSGGLAAVLVAFVAFSSFAASSAAQTSAVQPPPPSPSTTTLTDIVQDDLLRDLPVTDNVFSVLETISAVTITDRFSSGGLSAAEPSRAGAFMNAWSQTSIRLGDIDITSPDGGVPLLAPPLGFLQRVGITSGGMPADASTPALLISLEPLRPSAQWTGTIDAFGLPQAFVANPVTKAPAIARPDAAMYGGGTLSGPLIRDRLGLVLSMAWNRSSQFERGNAVAGDDGIASVFGHLLYTPDAQTEIRTIAWIQRAGYPSTGRIPYASSGASDHDAGAHVQSTWERRASPRTNWRAFAGFTTQTRSAAAPSPGPATIERLIDGPIPTLVDAADGTRRRLTVGVRANASRDAWGRAHRIEAGFDTGRASEQAASAYPSTVFELVEGIPARAWQYSPPLDTRRSATTVDGFVADHLAVSRRLTLDAALRFDAVSGAALNAARGVTWHTWLPRAALRASVIDRWGLAVFSTYSRSADALTLSTLAYGDPAAPTADVFRWSGGSGLGPLIARMGPGAGADGLTTIDPRVARPLTEEFNLGIEAGPLRSIKVRFAETLKRESHALAVINTGVPASSYAVRGFPDVGLSFEDPVDDQTLPVYDRLPSSFGRDRFLLTNTPARDATFGGMNVSVTAAARHLTLFTGAKTNIAMASAGSRGFHATENDVAALGELFTDPNAATHARGRPFFDRSYTVKLAGVYRFSRGVRLGVIARYQDGQPFSRTVVVADLNQGAEPIRAVSAGRSRFTYTGTFDVRLQKEFVRARTHIALVADIYNLPNMRKEVEEDVVLGPRYRVETAVQPPRAVVLGVRVTM